MSTEPDFGPELPAREATEAAPEAGGKRTFRMPFTPPAVAARLSPEPTVPDHEEGQGEDDEALGAGEDGDEFDDTADDYDDYDDPTSADGDEFDDDQDYADDGEDWDGEDGQDYGDDPTYAPPPPVKPGAVVRVGAWNSWLSMPERPGRHPAAQTGHGDDFDDENDEFALPDYDAMNSARGAGEGSGGYTEAARAAFTDRSGGRGAAVRARLKRGRDKAADSDREVYRARSAGVAILAVAGVALGVVVIVVVNVKHSSPLLTPAKPGPSPAAVTSPVSGTAAAPGKVESYPHATSDCYATKTADTVVGAGPGDPSTGPGAILGFDWAYYSDRNGARARDWVATDAKLPDAAGIQAGIDSAPVGTKYCVHIARDASDGTGSTWNVVLSEQYPTDPAPQQINQLITTRAEGGRVLITAIRKAD